jgi:hypothetical protein
MEELHGSVNNAEAESYQSVDTTCNYTVHQELLKHKSASLLLLYFGSILRYCPATTTANLAAQTNKGAARACPCGRILPQGTNEERAMRLLK